MAIEKYKSKRKVLKMTDSEEKKKALESVFSVIEKEYGTGSIMKLGDANSVDVEVIPTGSLTLDMALGVGGLPRGRVIEIYGPESSGKTTVALHVVAEAQKMGGEAAFIDAEHALDPVYEKKLGVDIENLIVAQPDTGEQAWYIDEAQVPKAEIDGELGDSHVGLLARLMSQALRKLTAVISKSGTVVIFINQLREKVGVMYGNPETTPGGRALKFFSSVRLDVRRGEVIKNGTELIGNKTKVKVVKNKVAPPFKTAEFDILYGEGISKEGNILDFAVENNIIKKSGAWFSYNGEKIGQGRDNVRKYMVENKEFTAEIDRQVRELLKNNSGYLPSEADNSDNTDGEQPTETETTETTEE